MQRTNNGSGGRNAEPLMGGDGTVYFLDDKRPIILYDGTTKQFEKNSAVGIDGHVTFIRSVLGRHSCMMGLAIPIVEIIS